MALDEKIIIENDRDQRTLEWLRGVVGDAAINACIQSMEAQGRRKPYVSNLCKLLGVTPPSRVVVTDKKSAKIRLEAIRKMIKQDKEG